jgi:tRNA nucleotidyltransferase (CCA-adding enzyme)
VDKMMKGRDPLYAIQLIHELRLYSSIFWTPPMVLKTFSSPPVDPLQGLIAATILNCLTTTPSPLTAIHPLLTQHFISHPSTRPRLFLASALTPFKDITYRDAKNKIHPGVEAVLRDGCKLGSQNNYLGGIPALFSAAELLKNPDLKGERFNRRPERVAIGEPADAATWHTRSYILRSGLLLRDKSVHNPNLGSTWPVSLLFSLVQELLPFWRSPDDYEGRGASSIP